MPDDGPPLAAGTQYDGAVGRLMRWLGVWLLVCSAAAAPSFYIAAENGFDRGAMVVGVLCFAFLYTAASGTRAFAGRYARDAALRTTMYLGYGIRCGLALAFPVSWMVDMVPGMISTGLIGSTELPPKAFAATLLTTLVQGVLLNLILAFFMAVAYPIVRAFMRRPTESRGFAVIPLAATPPAPPSGDPRAGR